MSNSGRAGRSKNKKHRTGVRTLNEWGRTPIIDRRTSGKGLLIGIIEKWALNLNKDISKLNKVTLKKHFKIIEINLWNEKKEA